MGASSVLHPRAEHGVSERMPFSWVPTTKLRSVCFFMVSMLFGLQFCPGFDVMPFQIKGVLNSLPFFAPCIMREGRIMSKERPPPNHFVVVIAWMLER